VNVWGRTDLCQGETVDVGIPEEGAARIGCRLSTTLFLKAGYLARPSTKVRNALFMWRSACCSGTQDTSFNYVVSDRCLSAADAA
jgi:hypothetical protein